MANTSTTKQGKTTKQVAKADEQKALAQAAEFEGFEGAGFEGADADSYAIPFLTILQSGSPQCKRSDGQYIKGAEEGMLFNTVTQELYDGDEGVTLVPVHFERKYVKWVPYDEGGGFLGELEVDDPEIARGERGDSGKLLLPDGNELADTRKHYMLLVKDDGTAEPILITMSSTQIKKSRNLMSRLRNVKLKGSKGLFTPPMFANVVKVTTTPEHNDQNSWYGWHPHLADLRQLDLSDEREADLFRQAKEFREAIVAGRVKEEQPQQPGAETDDAAEY